MNDISIRPYSGPSDDEAIFSFEPPYRPIWPWIARENPEGEPIIFMACDGAESIGGLAMFPRRLKIGTTEAVVYKGSPFVLPAYRRRGVFSRLAAEMEREVRSRGATVFGFPNPTSVGQWIEKMGGHVIGKVVKMEKPLSTPGILKRILAPGAAALPTSAHVQRVTLIDARFDACWARAKATYPVVAVRDRAHVAWLARKPGSESHVFAHVEDDRMCGWIVVAVENHGEAKTGAIQDLFTTGEDHERIARGLLAAAEDSFRAAQCTSASMRLRWSPLERVLERAGYRRAETRSIFAVSANFAPALATVPPEEDWFLAEADMFFS